MGFLNAVMLFGLAAVVLPIIVHFFSRKRYDEVDWAAMQFLTFDSATRRRMRLDHLVLLLLRCAAVVALAVALAAPTIPRRVVPRILGGTSKDVIVLIDNSASMAGAPSEAARQWALELIESLGSSDRLAIYSVRRGLTPLLPIWSTDRERARLQLNVVPLPAGRADWPAAVAAANALFDDRRRDCHVVVLTDGQKFGLADDLSLSEWSLIRGSHERMPRTWVVALPSNRAAGTSPFVIDPIVTSRGAAIANRDLQFRTTIRNPNGAIPPKVKVEWDGRAGIDAPVGADGTILLTRRFPAGSHVLSIHAESARQDFAFDVVPHIPVLVVNGDAVARPSSLIPISIALAPAKSTGTGFTVRTIPIDDFGTLTIQQDVAGADSAPKLVILTQVEKLTADQNLAIEQFLKKGGSVLIALGDRCKSTAWNSMALRGGQGWLPARIDRRVDGAEASPLPAASSHPAMQSFRDSEPGGLASARFPQYWKLDPTAAPQSVTVCSLTTGDPFLVERGFGRGRVLLSCIPFDRTGQTNFTALPDYVRLVHELAYSLAGTNFTERNLVEGMPIVLMPHPPEPVAGVTLVAPNQPARIVPVSKWPFVFNETNAAGIYRLTTSMGRVYDFTVRSDARELDPAMIDERDRTAMKAAVPGMAFIIRPDEIEPGQPGREDEPASQEAVVSNVEVWWIFMIAVLVLFGVELGYARRLAAATR